MGKTFTPVQRNWKFFEDDAAEPTTQLANENTQAPLNNNNDVFRLRVEIAETGDVTSNNTLTVEYDTNSGFPSPTALGPSAHFDYGNGQATEGDTVTRFGAGFADGRLDFVLPGRIQHS